ncbi:MAG: DEAD/DEAH box helicase family protein, partial [Methanobrevibacter sp.]|nr:DEAD/DEAH box helicase family protein [Methanobrevibacter sp.]
MARVIYDGTRIIVDAARLNVEKLNELAEKFNAEYISSLNAFAFNRTANSVIEISKIENAVFDESFIQLKATIDKVIQRRQNEMAAMNFPEQMYPFQKESVYQMLHMTGNILLASDQGTGKSLMSIIYLLYRSKMKECYPAVVICPASLKTNWAVEFSKWNPDVKTYVINGRTSYDDRYVLNSAKQADVVIINYDILGVDDKEAQKREKERIKTAKENGWFYRKAFIPISGWVDYINEVIKPKVLICDEVQAIESAKTVRTRGVTQIAVNDNVLKLFLSGTPFETRVAQFYNACHLLAPHIFPKEWDFKQRYCDPYYNGFGWQYKGASNIPELREKLSGIMIRHRKEDVLSQLPEKQKIPIYFDMDKNSRKVYDQMEMELA